MASRSADPGWTVEPLTPQRWPALEALFGPRGACNGCWCMYWRIGNAYRQRPREHNRNDFCAIVRRGPPPGLLAFHGPHAIGWCQLTPRAALPRIDRNWRLKRVDELPVWSLSCFFVRKDLRRRGVTAALLAAAVRAAYEAGAPALEGYPLDPAHSGSSSWTGYVSTFERAGFAEVARRVPARPIMRLTFSSPS